MSLIHPTTYTPSVVRYRAALRSDWEKALEYKGFKRNSANATKIKNGTKGIQRLFAAHKVPRKVPRDIFYS